MRCILWDAKNGLFLKINREFLGRTFKQSLTSHINVRHVRLAKAGGENDGRFALGKLTYAVANPRAVVIKLGDASIAHGAMFRSDGLPYLWSTGVKMSVLCEGTSMETAMQIRLLGYQPANARGDDWC